MALRHNLPRRTEEYHENLSHDSLTLGGIRIVDFRLRFTWRW